MIVILSIILGLIVAFVGYANFLYWTTPMTEEERQEERDDLFTW
jgi:hypothetical protein